MNDLLPPALLSEYLALQQEADFALWRAREANERVRLSYTSHLAGGSALTDDELREISEVAVEAELKYRTLRAFLRQHLAGTK